MHGFIQALFQPDHAAPSAVYFLLSFIRLFRRPYIFIDMPVGEPPQRYHAATTHASEFYISRRVLVCNSLSKAVIAYDLIRLRYFT